MSLKWPLTHQIIVFFLIIHIFIHVRHLEQTSSIGHAHQACARVRRPRTNYSERSEVSTRARELFRMASGRIFRVRLNFISYSLRRLRPRRHVLLSQKLWPPSRWSCKAYKLYCSAGLCLPGKSIFARPKTIAPSWPEVVRPVADGKDVASCGLSIGLLLASFFQD